MHFRPRCVCRLFTRSVWVDCAWEVGVVEGGLRVNDYFVCVGLCGKI